MSRHTSSLASLSWNNSTASSFIVVQIAVDAGDEKKKRKNKITGKIWDKQAL